MIGVITSGKSSGGGGTMDHNGLQNLQGGGIGEYFHTTEEQHSKLLDLIYKNQVSSISIVPAFGEKGVAVPLALSYQIQSNDDIFESAGINNGIGSVTDKINAGMQAVNLGGYKSTVAFNLSLSFTRKELPQNEIRTATYNAYLPQWAGSSAAADFLNLNQIGNAGIQKYIQASASVEKLMSPADEYIWFISSKADAIIKDGNNFVQTLGEWNDGASEFYRRSFLLTLADGVTMAEVFYYRSRNKKTFSNLTFKIS